ncbi:guided entry of tail-anchored proteins factor 1-like [Dysidea avara]|uniref:guided entry of tail-anchored proteins factor 1-like n=1 Tax=Dysidea avara TaxID=196820 RepID=UPI0033249F7C
MDVEVNLYSLLLIFVVSLVIHIAVNRLMSFCSLAMKIFTPRSSGQNNSDAIVKEIADLQKEQSTLDPVNDFAKHAKLQRKINANQDKVKSSKTKYKKSTRWRKWTLYICLRILLEAICLATVWHCSNLPVISVPEQWFHPLNKILYPLWKRGEVRSIFWMISCRQAVRQVFNSRVIKAK